MQVMNDRGMPLEIEAEQIAWARSGEIDVAIVVVKDVLSPVGNVMHWRKIVGVVNLVAVIPVSVAVASIGIGCRVDRDDHIPAYSVDDRTVLDGKPVGQF